MMHYQCGPFDLSSGEFQNFPIRGLLNIISLHTVSTLESGERNVVTVQYANIKKTSRTRQICAKIAIMVTTKYLRKRVN